MKTIFKISALLALYLLTTAKSCDNREQNEEARETARFQTIHDSLTVASKNDSIDEAAKFAFETSACQKVYDLADYLIILADKNTGEQFVKKTAELTRHLFISSAETLNFSFPENPVENNFLSKRMKDAGFKNVNIPDGVVFDSVWVKQKLLQVNDSLYAGKLGVSALTGATAVENGKLRHLLSVDFYVVKREKIFGGSIHKIWTVLLGDIQ
ncbi:MAG: hypothetical protein NT004_07810 [Bacteroidetes bacterium]|nr:hypothetical protein [Bacteroidota bacterium]